MQLNIVYLASQIILFIEKIIFYFFGNIIFQVIVVFSDISEIFFSAENNQICDKSLEVVWKFYKSKLTVDWRPARCIVLRS